MSYQVFTLDSNDHFPKEADRCGFCKDCPGSWIPAVRRSSVWGRVQNRTVQPQRQRPLEWGDCLCLGGHWPASLASTYLAPAALCSLPTVKTMTIYPRGDPLLRKRPCFGHRTAAGQRPSVLFLSHSRPLPVSIWVSSILCSKKSFVEPWTAVLYYICSK